MAERRMFAKTIVLSDAFLDLPMSARCLYFTLGMLADDDGFVGNPKSIMRQCGSTADDMNILLAKRYVLGFESGIIVIKHWRMNNYLQKDRYNETTYLEEKATLTTDEKGAYIEKDGTCIQPVYELDTQVRLGKDRLGKDSVNINAQGQETIGTIGRQCPTEKRTFKEPTLDEVREYCIANGYEEVDAEKFISYYSKNNWTVKGKNGKRRKMKNWKLCLNSWVVNEIRFNKTNDLRNRAREAYIRDVELKEKREETKGGLFFFNDTDTDTSSD